MNWLKMTLFEQTFCGENLKNDLLHLLYFAQSEFSMIKWRKKSYYHLKKLILHPLILKFFNICHNNFSTLDCKNNQLYTLNQAG